MGKNGTRSSIKKNKEIQYKIMQEYGVSYDQLYKIWDMYCNYIIEGKSGKEAIEEMKKMDDEYWNKALTFFISYALVFISSEILNNELVGKE